MKTNKKTKIALSALVLMSGITSVSSQQVYRYIYNPDNYKGSISENVDIVQNGIMENLGVQVARDVNYNINKVGGEVSIYKDTNTESNYSVLPWGNKIVSFSNIKQKEIGVKILSPW